MDIVHQLLVHPGDAAKAAKILKETEALSNFECQMRKKRECCLGIHQCPDKSVSDGDRTIEGFVTDITERKRSEEALRENEDKYRSIVEQSMMGIGLSKEIRSYSRTTPC